MYRHMMIFSFEPFSYSLMSIIEMLLLGAFNGLSVAYEFHFSCQTQQYTKNSLIFHCAQLSLLVAQCRYVFRLMEPSSWDTSTTLYN
jgi:hypothetical protein